MKGPKFRFGCGINGFNLCRSSSIFDSSLNEDA